MCPAGSCATDALTADNSVVGAGGRSGVVELARNRSQDEPRSLGALATELLPLVLLESAPEVAEHEVEGGGPSQVARRECSLESGNRSAGVVDRVPLGLREGAHVRARGVGCR